MKKTFCFFVLLTLGMMSQALAQVAKFNYQAVLRDTSGAVLANTPVNVDFSVHKLVSGGGLISAETHSSTTDEFGLIELVIGGGTPISGWMDSLTTYAGSAYLSVKVNGTPLGTSQLLSVPYSLRSARSYSANFATNANHANTATALTPKTHILSLPATAFVPNGNASYVNSLGNGGATITAPAPGVLSVLNAPFNLPHGAKITSFTVYYRDESAVDFSITLFKEYFASGFATYSAVTTSGNVVGVRSTTNTLSHTVNNNDGGYFIRVFCSNWAAAGAKDIKGVKILYTY